MCLNSSLDRGRKDVFFIVDYIVQVHLGTVVDDNSDIDTFRKLGGDDLLSEFGGCVQVNMSLVDLHGVSVPGF